MRRKRSGPFNPDGMMDNGDDGGGGRVVKKSFVEG